MKSGDFEFLKMCWSNNCARPGFRIFSCRVIWVIHDHISSISFQSHSKLTWSWLGWGRGAENFEVLTLIKIFEFSDRICKFWKIFIFKIKNGQNHSSTKKCIKILWFKCNGKIIFAEIIFNNFNEKKASQSKILFL